MQRNNYINSNMYCMLVGAYECNCAQIANDLKNAKSNFYLAIHCAAKKSQNF